VRLRYPLYFVTLGEQDALAEGGYVVLVGARSASASSSEEVPLNWNKWVRQTHRWLSIAFTVAVIVNIVALGQEEPAVWVGLLALLPLALLLFTGLYLFVLPYATTWRSGRRTD
jgi:cellulose synthase/poly-beta-1,6-N-acetylglucosamine synthase-like glycosyltransferase